MVLPARGTPSRVSHGLGPGRLWIAPLGSTEPTTLTADWDVAWIPLGYTEEGSEFSYELSSDPVEVAEELDPISTVITARNISVSFASAEATVEHFKVAMNGGTITTGTGIVIFEPPDLGSEVRTMIGFQTEDAKARWVYRQCFQSGNVTTQRRKGADKATIPMEFSVEKPASGAKAFKVIQSDVLSPAP